MELLQPSPHLRQLLDHYWKIGGVIYHFLVSAHPTEFDSDYERHRQAVIYAIHSLEPTKPTDPVKLHGQPITVAQFLGEADPAKVKDENQLGYLYAFTEPPYGMGASPEALTTLREAILQELVDGLPPSIRLYAWSTDWAPYFDLGHEWWGSYLWTLESPSHVGTIAVIAASTTD